MFWIECHSSAALTPNTVPNVAGLKKRVGSSQSACINLVTSRSPRGDPCALVNWGRVSRGEKSTVNALRNMSEQNKPNAEALGWTITEANCPYQNKVLKVRADNIQFRDGRQIEYAYIERSPAVIIVPVTRDGQIVTLRQYRYPVDEWCIEVPAGGTQDTGDESLEDVALKELREEVGVVSAALTSVGFFYSTPSLTDERCHVFLAENVELTEKPRTEVSEEIMIDLVDANKAMELARTGKMKNSPCALALLLCEPTLRDRGYL